MKLILHIGMQRTGTTFLQYYVFPKIKEINLVDFDNCDNRIIGNKEIKNMLCKIENYSSETVIKKIYNRCKQEKINLISEENIYCKMFDKEDNRYVKINKIKKCFPNAKIIFGIREKRTSLASWYIKYVMVGGTKSFEEYVDKIENIEKLNYEPYIDYLYEIYSKDDVYIYKFEDLKKDAIGFAKGICDFIDVPIPNFEREKRKNVAYNLNQLKLALLINRVLTTKWNKRFFSSIEKHNISQRFLRSKIFTDIPGKKIKIHDLKKI